MSIGLLTAGVAFLVTRSRQQRDENAYIPKARHRSPFAPKPHSAGSGRLRPARPAAPLGQPASA
ncbi:MAG: hypothetical protein WKG07_14640 [Hymenobacter sp.]